MFKGPKLALLAIAATLLVGLITTVVWQNASLKKARTKEAVAEVVTTITADAVDKADKSAEITDKAIANVEKKSIVADAQNKAIIVRSKEKIAAIEQGPVIPMHQTVVIPKIDAISEVRINSYWESYCLATTIPHANCR